MVELIVIRHAIAFESDSTRWPDDRLRPLTPEGKRKFRTAASGLSRWIPRVDLLLTSPLLRARQTAEILTDVAGWPKAAEHRELDPGSELRATLASLRPNKQACIALVGHEPHLSALIGLCVAEPASALHLEMKKGAAAVITFPDAIRAGSGTLIALVPPRALRRMT